MIAQTEIGSSPVRWRQLPLRPDLTATIALVPLVFILCAGWKIEPNLNLGDYVLISVGLILISAIPALLVWGLLRFCRSERESAQRRGGFIWLVIETSVALTVVCWVYSHLKAGVLLGSTFDEELYQLDCLLFGGAEPWVLSRALIPEELAGFLALVYMAFLPVVLASILLLALTGHKGTATQLLCAIMLGYYFGGLAYHIVPAYGPAFTVASARTEELNGSVASVQQLILYCTRLVQADRGSAEIQPWTYVAAFPSLHFSHVLITTWYLRKHRLACWAMGVFTALTAVSTVYFGWHYVVDWVGGIAVAALAIGLTTLWARRRQAVLASETIECSTDGTVLEAIALSCRQGLTPGLAWVKKALEGNRCPAPVPVPVESDHAPDFYVPLESVQVIRPTVPRVSGKR